MSVKNSMKVVSLFFATLLMSYLSVRKPQISELTDSSWKLVRYSDIESGDTVSIIGFAKCTPNYRISFNGKRKFNTIINDEWILDGKYTIDNRKIKISAKIDVKGPFEECENELLFRENFKIMINSTNYFDVRGNQLKLFYSYLSTNGFLEFKKYD